MATFIGNMTVTGADTQVASLGDNENLFVDENATLLATGTGSEVVNATTGSDMVIDGNLHSLLSHAIQTSGGSHAINIGPSGSVTSTGAAGVGILLGGGGNFIRNAGVVTGAATGGVAITVAGNTGSLIINIGQITGALGISVSGAGCALFNSGVIAADTIAYSGGNSATGDLLTNTGLIRGNINLGGGNDTLDSREGMVVGAVSGGTGSDVLLGGRNADDLSGDDGNDTLDGGAGDDSLNGGTGADSLDGGEGDDIYVIGDSDDIITERLGEGEDTVTVIALITYTLTPSAEVEILVSDATDATVVGNESANRITTENGDNVLDGGGGADTLIGAGGSDIYFVGDPGDQVIEGPSPGTDEVRASISFTLTDIDVENLTLLGTANINATGNAGVNVLTGNGGSNILDGRAGNDSLIGGLGNDTYVVDSAGDSITENAGQGADTVRAAVSFSLLADPDLENLTLLGTGNLGGTGNASANVIIGNAGANTLQGLAGNDNLNGGAGNDMLVGGLGRDMLTGGLGADRFDFNSLAESPRGSGRDTVFFVRTQGDKIDLRDIDADTDGTAGNQAFRFIGGAAFHGIDGELRFASGILQGDTNGDRVADIEIRVVGALAAGDIFL